MRCGSGNGVEDLAVGGLPAHEVVPSSFPEQTHSRRAQQALTRVWDAAASVCRGLDA